MWEAARRGGAEAGRLDRASYSAMHKALTRAVEPTATREEQAVEEEHDWLGDSDGDGGVTQERLACSLVEAAAARSGTTEAGQVERCLVEMTRLAIVRAADGHVEWRGEGE